MADKSWKREAQRLLRHARAELNCRNLNGAFSCLETYWKKRPENPEIQELFHKEGKSSDQIASETEKDFLDVDFFPARFTQ